MFTKYFIPIMLSVVSGLQAIAQPASISKGKVTGKKEPFCDSLQFIINNSSGGFAAFRYNEKTDGASTLYNTVLPSMGFENKFVQTGTVTPYKQSVPITLPFFIATKKFNDDILAAYQFYTTTKKKLLNCLKPNSQDSALKPGFTRYTGFQLMKTVKDSFVTAELILLSDKDFQTVAFRLFHNKASTQKGNMKNPPGTAPVIIIPVVTNPVVTNPIATNTDKYHYEEVLPFLQTLISSAPDNFVPIRDKKLDNQQWKDTYSSLVSFRKFTAPVIEYITDNFWNRYNTRLYFADEAVATQSYNKLVTEIQSCSSSITFQGYGIKYSTATEKWWNYKQEKKDSDGKNYKNTLNLSLSKSTNGDGYYITLLFSKNPG